MDTKAKILNIDDDPDFNALLKVVLKKNGFHSITTETPNDFAEALKVEKPDLCLIDINLDIASGAGFTMLQAVRNTFGLEIPLIILSRRSSREDIGKALELGANDFVSKPLDDTFLIQKINQYLRNPELKPLTYSKVSERDWPCEVTIDLGIQAINEFGVTLSSEHFLSKGSYIELKGSLVKEIINKDTPLKLTVNNSWIDEETKRYQAFCEFNYEDLQMMSTIRSYLLKNSASQS